MWTWGQALLTQLKGAPPDFPVAMAVLMVLGLTGLDGKIAQAAAPLRWTVYVLSMTFFSTSARSIGYPLSISNSNANRSLAMKAVALLAAALCLHLAINWKWGLLSIGSSEPRSYLGLPRLLVQTPTVLYLGDSVLSATDRRDRDLRAFPKCSRTSSAWDTPWPR